MQEYLTAISEEENTIQKESQQQYQALETSSLRMNPLLSPQQTKNKTSDFVTAQDEDAVELIRTKTEQIN